MRTRRGLVGLGMAVCLTAGIWTTGPAQAMTRPAVGSTVVDPPAPKVHRPSHDHFARGSVPFTGAAVALMTSVAVALVVGGLVMVAIRRRDVGY